MKLTLHTNQIGLRILGTAMGAAFLCVGAYTLFGGDGLSVPVADRARGFGLAALIAGVWAIAVSWLDRDLTGVWCRPPTRWRRPPGRR